MSNLGRTLAKIRAAEVSQDEADHAVEAEAALVGAILLHASRADVSETLAKLPPVSSEDFLSPKYRSFWRAAMACIDRDGVADIVLVMDELKRRTEASETMAQDLGECIGVVSTPEVTAAYGRRVFEASMLRKAKDQIASAGDVSSPEELHERLQKIIGETLGRIRPDSNFAPQSRQSIMASIRAAWQARKDGTFVTLSTGIHQIDRQLGGLTDVVIVAGRPGMGKSSLARQIAAHQALTRKVVYVGLEEEPDEVIQRLCFGVAGLSYTNYLRGRIQVGAAEMDRIMAPYESGQLKIEVRRPRASPDDVARTLRIAAYEGAEFSVVDHLQEVKVGRRRNEEKTDFVERAATEIIGTAKDCKLPLALVAQLNRECERRPDKRPMMSDIRNTGELEQSAGQILFTFLAYRYDPSVPQTQGEIIVGKQRNGEEGVIPIPWDGPRQWFGTLPDGDEIPPPDDSEFPPF